MKKLREREEELDKITEERRRLQKQLDEKNTELMAKN